MKSTTKLIGAAVIVATLALAGCSSHAGSGGGVAVDSSSPSASPSSAGRTVLYEVTGGGTADISYFTLNNGQSGSESANGAALPWSKQLTIAKGGTFSFSSLTLTAIGDANTTTISCDIKVDGVVKAQQTSTGAYSTVTCNASGS
jgi:hypothetical protein